MKKIAVRPGVQPTHDDKEGGRRWHYLSPEKERLDPYAYLYEHVCGGWGGECDHYGYPDGYSPKGPAMREHIEARIEEKLRSIGYDVLDA